jgi:hypothetical protein
VADIRTIRTERRGIITSCFSPLVLHSPTSLHFLSSGTSLAPRPVPDTIELATTPARSRSITAPIPGPSMDIHPASDSQQHQQQQHTPQQPRILPAPPPDKSLQRPYKCPYPQCGRSFSRLEHQVSQRPSISSSPLIIHPDSSYSHPHWRETLPLYFPRLRKAIFSQRRANAPHADPYQRETR